MFHTTIDTAGIPETFEDRDGSKVRAWLSEHLKVSTDDFVLDWKPVVELTVTKGRMRSYGRDKDHEAGLMLKFERYWLALTPTKDEWRKIAWELGDPESPSALEPNECYPQSERFRDGPNMPKVERPSWHWRDRPFRLPYFEGDSNEPTHYIEYTPEVWAGLLEVLRVIENARVAIGEIVGTKTGLVTLAEVGAGKIPLMLSAPTKAKGKTK